MDVKEALVAASIFSRLSKDSLEALSRAARTRSFAAGDLLAVEDEEAQTFFVLMSGEVEVVKRKKSGGEVKLGTFKKGDFFGEMALLDGFPRSASVRAVTDCEAAVIVRWDFLGTIRAHPEVALDILKVLSSRLRNAERPLVP